VLLLQAPRGAGPPRPPPMHSRHQNLPEASQGDHKMYLTHLEQVRCCLGLQAGAAMLTALLVLLVLNAYALIDQQLQQTTINHSTLNSTPTHATPHAHSFPVALGKLACVNLQGGWLPPSPPAIAISVQIYTKKGHERPRRDFNERSGSNFALNEALRGWLRYVQQCRVG
jgi:hypothetical protein